MFKADIYRNLRKLAWSIRASGLVRGWAYRIKVYDAKFVVNQGGRLRVLDEGQRNIHAFVRGEISGSEIDNWEPPENAVEDLIEVTYSPWSHGTFVVKATGYPIYESNIAFMIHPRVWVPRSSVGV